MSEQFYYEENDKLYRIRIERDDQPWNPREENDGYIGTMVCEYPHYELGDISRAKVEEYLDRLLRDNVEEKTIINYVKNGKTSNNLVLKYDRHVREWQLWAIVRKRLNAPDDNKWRQYIDIPNIIADTDQTVDWLIDDIIDALPIGDKLNLLQRKGFLFLPLAIYDHSGITMWAGSKWQGIDAQWDCSDVGFIYTTKEKCKEQWCKLPKDWRKRAEKELNAEVKEYDCYLRGDVYVFYLDRYNPEDDDWDEDIESCWGFISDKWGEELVRDMDITSEPLISEDDAEMAMVVMRDIALEEKEERKVMAQAEYTVAI